VLAERCCKKCGETFEFERKRGGQRIYCFECEPPGTQLVWVRGRLKLRHRPALYSRVSVWSMPLRPVVVRQVDPDGAALLADLEREGLAYVDFLADLERSQSVRR
jgi:hypothetical protein